MTGLFNALKWLKALSKRLLKKPSFLITLLLIPLAAFSVGKVAEEDSGIITVAIFSESRDEDLIYESIKNELLSETSSFLFVEYDDLDKLKQDIYNKKINCGWVFKDNLSQRIIEYVNSPSADALVDVYLAQDSSLYKLSREKLYSYLYKNLSYDVFLSYMESKGFDNDFDAQIEYQALFNSVKNRLSDNIIEIEFLGAPEKKIEDLNYVSSPIKGLLGIAMLICCLAAMLYSLEDENAGKYSMFPVVKRLWVHLIAVLAAAVFSGVAVFVSRIVVGDIQNTVLEVFNMIIYIVSSVGFCTLIGIICKKQGIMCLAFPIVAVAALALCSVFVGSSDLIFIKFAIPTLYYMRISIDISYITYSIIYIIIVYSLCFTLYKIRNKE